MQTLPPTGKWKKDENIYEEGKKLESRGQRAEKKNVIEHSISHKTIESDFVPQMSPYFNYFVSRMKL